MSMLNKIVNVITFPIKLCVLGLIYIYKMFISPVIPKSCKFTPTCSSYMILAIKRFGIFRGFFIGFKRILKCNPKSHGGLDPVPDNIKGDVKWIV